MYISTVPATSPAFITDLNLQTFLLRVLCNVTKHLKIMLLLEFIIDYLLIVLLLHLITLLLAIVFVTCQNKQNNATESTLSRWPNPK